uniref:Chitin-binding type-2 domain-containing protein n=1 Tax=Meloidogyne hapla TaxID=6305 RepID=A0A1I8AYA3_MELHA
MSAIGDCRSEFLFCNGMRPQLFQCDRAGDVFKDGECVAANVANCNVCQPGEMKRSTDKCEQFFFCESNDNSPTNWRQYICTDGNVFHPQRQECVSPSEFQCPIKTQCQEGDYYSVECGDFFLCVQGKYIIAKCPDWTQWNGKEKRCEQKSSTDLSKLTCSEGEIRPSSDCKTFEECRSGSWIKKSCHEYASDRLKDPCRFCKQTQTSIITKEKYEDYYPVENVLPEGFNPFNEKIGIKQRRCIEGEVRELLEGHFIYLKKFQKIINKHDCTHFMECIDGDWFNLACPTNYYFNTKTLGCVLATSSLNSSFIPICQEFENKINLKLNNNNLQLNNDKIESLHLLPIYSANDSFYVKRATPGLGPLPELNDKVLKANYKYSFVFCTAKSPLRIPNYYDCTKYSECALELGGYYTEKQCALGTQFDPSLLMCTYNYTCLPTNCTSGQRQSLPECGKAKECRDGKWHEFTCPNSMAFVDGKCSEESPGPLGFRSDRQNCSKFYQCAGGKWIQKDCAKGTVFNSAIGVCDWPTNVPSC